MPLWAEIALGMLVGTWLIDLTHSLIVLLLSRKANKRARSQLMEFYEQAKRVPSGRI